MASLISITAPSIQFSVLRRRAALGLGFPTPSPDLRTTSPRSSVISRVFPAPHLPEFESTEGLARELVSRVEGLVYTVADAAVAAENAKDSGSGDWLSGITGYLETVLKVLKDGLSTLNVPYSYGFAIILLTVLVKAATFPLTRKQVESALSMRTLQPQVKAIQKRYAGDPERIQSETSRLYKLAGVNPLAGCLPTLITIPIWLGLYRALSNVANEGLLSEGFFWIPSLAGPTTIAARQSGSGISWLFPFVDGHPPLGWHDTLAYLVLPLLLVISQYISAQMMQPAQIDDSQKNAQVITKFLPLMIGYFALSVPSGLSLYWLTNNILSSAQQIWLQKLGGAKNPVQEYIDRTNRDESSSSEKNVPETVNNIFEDARKTEVKSSLGEDGGSNRLAPGERFKQIKEQESRRRKEREENERAQESASDYQMTNEENNEGKLNENEAEEESKNDLMELKLPITNNGGFNNHGLNVIVNSRDENDASLHGVSQKNETE